MLVLILSIHMKREIVHFIMQLSSFQIMETLILNRPSDYQLNNVKLKMFSKKTTIFAEQLLNDQ